MARGDGRGRAAGWPCLGHAAVCAGTESALQVPVTECHCRALGWESWEMKSRCNKINADAEPGLFQYRKTRLMTQAHSGSFLLPADAQEASPVHGQGTECC